MNVKVAFLRALVEKSAGEEVTVHFDWVNMTELPRLYASGTLRNVPVLSESNIKLSHLLLCSIDVLNFGSYM